MREVPCATDGCDGEASHLPDIAAIDVVHVPSRPRAEGGELLTLPELFDPTHSACDWIAGIQNTAVDELCVIQWVRVEGSLG